MSLILSRVVCLPWSLCCSFLGTETLRSLLPDTRTVTFLTKYQVCSPPGILMDWCRLFLWCPFLFLIRYQRFQRLCKFYLELADPSLSLNVSTCSDLGMIIPSISVPFYVSHSIGSLTVSFARFASKAAPVGSVQVSGSNDTCKSVCLFGSWLMYFSKFLELPGVELSFPWKTTICSENCIWCPHFGEPGSWPLWYTLVYFSTSTKSGSQHIVTFVDPFCLWNESDVM